MFIVKNADRMNESSFKLSLLGIGLDQDLSAGKVTYRSDREIGFLSARDNIRWNVTLIKNGINDDKADTNRGLLVNGRVMDSNGNVLRRTEGAFIIHFIIYSLFITSTADLSGLGTVSHNSSGTRLQFFFMITMTPQVVVLDDFQFHSFSN